ncbi:MAG TPA: primase-like DNA-binding domain-containing protein, partial [Gammaproteobacteria bacterium]|nr:primase-like DNA-binding domain-containing protein [Gammaproteobacteria bacterium]
ERTEAYRREEDIVGMFVEERCEVEGEVSRRELYRAWARWCRERGEDHGTLKQLRRRFQERAVEHGWEEARVDGQRGYKGVSLKEEDLECLA